MTDFSINNLVRSAVILVVGLPVTLGVASSISKTDPVSDAISAAKAPLVAPCLEYMISKPDSKLERGAKDRVDAVMGSDGADYKGLCGYVLN